MNSNLVTEAQTPAPSSAARFVPLLVIFVAAVAYYGSYWHFWFNPHDEGGTACLVAQRLMQGERPWVDVEPGYNIGWFYPIVALFHITGVNYLAVRAWFFVLATITALLGCGIVTRVTGSRWWGLVTGLLLVVFPGSQFKDYIPLAEAANTACLIHLLYADPRLRRKWLGSVVLGGVVLGLTFLVRVELGYFFTAIWALLLFVSLFDRRASLSARFAGWVLGILAIVLGVLIVQAPVYATLRSQGLEKQYLAEYTDWLEFLRGSLCEKMGIPRAPSPTSLAKKKAAKGNEAVEKPPAEVHKSENGERSVLPRRTLSSILNKGWHERFLTFLTYAPLIGFAVFFVAGVIGFFAVLARREFTLTAVPLQWLVLIGGSMTTFPQFFLFRPDRPHLSEFMPGYIIAMMASAWLLWPRGSDRSVMRRAFAGLVVLFLAGQLAIFAMVAFQHPSAGTIVARAGRKARFQGENGVRVHTSKKEAVVLQGVYDAVKKASGPSDYLICFPYMPGYNIMTNRRTYLRNVYVDNATRGEHWAENTIRDFEEKHPAVVITDDREINGTPASKFSHWGAPVYAYLKKHYTLAAKFDEIEIFVPPVPAKPETSEPPGTLATPTPPVNSTPPAAPPPTTPVPATPVPTTPPPPTTPVPATPAPTTPAPSPSTAPAPTTVPVPPTNPAPPPQ